MEAETIKLYPGVSVADLLRLIIVRRHCAQGDEHANITAQLESRLRDKKMGAGAFDTANAQVQGGVDSGLHHLGQNWSRGR